MSGPISETYHYRKWSVTLLVVALPFAYHDQELLLQSYTNLTSNSHILFPYLWHNSVNYGIIVMYQGYDYNIMIIVSSPKTGITWQIAKIDRHSKMHLSGEIILLICKSTMLHVHRTQNISYAMVVSNLLSGSDFRIHRVRIRNIALSVSVFSGCVLSRIYNILFCAQTS